MVAKLAANVCKSLAPADGVGGQRVEPVAFGAGASTVAVAHASAPSAALHWLAIAK